MIDTAEDRAVDIPALEAPAPPPATAPPIAFPRDDNCVSVAAVIGTGQTDVEELLLVVWKTEGAEAAGYVLVELGGGVLVGATLKVERDPLPLRAL